ncbi:MAG: hypothetical protein AAF355_08995 [Myxococcota bacterium]
MRPDEQAEQRAPQEVEGSRIVPSTGTSTVDPRKLSRSQNFAELIARIRVLEEHSQGDSSAACLFEERDSFFQFQADLAPAVRPLPEPSRDIAKRMRDQPGAVSLMTRFGWFGPGPDEPQLTLVALTTTSLQPGRALYLLALTERGAWMRTPEGEITGPHTGAALTDALRAAPQTALIAISADAELSIETLVRLIAQIPAEKEVVLTVPLPPTTSLPSDTLNQGDGSETEAGLCISEASPVPPETPGEIEISEVRTALAGFQTTAARCVSATSHVGPMRIVIHFRVVAQRSRGTVREACVAEAAGTNARLRECVVEALEETIFPEPIGGEVVFSLPLELEPKGPSDQHGMCTGH